MSTDPTVDALWTTLGQPLRRFVGRRVSDPHAADDIVQDVMLKALTRAAEDGLPVPEKLAAWVLAIARNAVTDHYRQRRRDTRVSVDQIEPAAKDQDDAELAQAAGHAAPCVRAMVARLPWPYAEAVRLVDMEGLAQIALADEKGLSVSGAKSRVQRGRQMLREMILDCCHLEMDSRGHVIDYHRTERSAQYCGGGTSAACGEDPASSEARLRL